MIIPDSLYLLIQKYLAGNASAAEEKIINDWYNSFDDASVEIKTPNGINEVELGAKIKGKIFAGISNSHTGIVKSINKWWLKAAAAIGLILLSTATYLILSNKKNTLLAQVHEKLLTGKNNILPGGNKATLTLADGSLITLDSASNGVLANRDGAKITKLNSGQVVYNTNENFQLGQVILYNTITTPRGGQYQITLSDGTKVWLNAASSIRYPTVFTGKEREVEITGEAYFEVYKNAAKPFNVLVNGALVNVLGTHFNIMAYSNETSINTTLIEGSLRIIKGVATCLLVPGEQAKLNKNGIIEKVKDATLSEAVAWKNGQFVFNGTDIKTIMRQIERWYDVEVIFNENINLHLSGQITRTANVNDLLKKLALTNAVHFKLEGRKIIVSN